MKNRNKLGTMYVNGKELSEDSRRIVIDNLIEGGAYVSDLQLQRGHRQRVSKTLVSMQTVFSQFGNVM